MTTNISRFVVSGFNNLPEDSKVVAALSFHTTKWDKFLEPEELFCRIHGDGGVLQVGISKIIDKLKQPFNKRIIEDANQGADFIGLINFDIPKTCKPEWYGALQKIPGKPLGEDPRDDAFFATFPPERVTTETDGTRYVLYSQLALTAQLLCLGGVEGDFATVEYYESDEND